jgi:hypothetical protein
VHCNETVSNRRLAELRASGEVIVATGATTGTLPFTVEPTAILHHGADLLGNPALFEEVGVGPVVIWDPIGGPIAISIAELLANGFGGTGNEAVQSTDQGREAETEIGVAGGTGTESAGDGNQSNQSDHNNQNNHNSNSGQGEAEVASKVTLVTPDFLVGEKLALTGDLAPSQPRLHGSRVKLIKRSLVRNVSATKVVLEDRFSGVQTIVPCKTFIACGHRLPNTLLDPSELYLQAGDRVAPRTIHEAILEGRRAALKL